MNELLIQGSGPDFGEDDEDSLSSLGEDILSLLPSDVARVYMRVSSAMQVHVVGRRNKQRLFADAYFELVRDPRRRVEVSGCGQRFENYRDKRGVTRVSSFPNTCRRPECPSCHHYKVAARVRKLLPHVRRLVEDAGCSLVPFYLTAPRYNSPAAFLNQLLGDELSRFRKRFLKSPIRAALLLGVDVICHPSDYYVNIHGVCATRQPRRTKTLLRQWPHNSRVDSDHILIPTRLQQRGGDAELRDLLSYNLKARVEPESLSEECLRNWAQAAVAFKNKNLYRKWKGSYAAEWGSRRSSSDSLDSEAEDKTDEPGTQSPQPNHDADCLANGVLPLTMSNFSTVARILAAGTRHPEYEAAKRTLTEYDSAFAARERFKAR